MRKAVKTVAMALVTALIVSLFAGCGGEEPVQTKSRASESEPDQILTDTTMTIYEKGATAAVIEAGMVKLYEKQDFTSLEDSVTIRFFNKKGEHTTTMTAMRGEIWGVYDGADSLRASGNVVVRSEENEAFLQAPAIRWVAADSLVYGDGMVRLNSENGYEEGTGFEAKDDLSEYRFRGPVTGEVRGGKNMSLDKKL